MGSAMWLRAPPTACGLLHDVPDATSVEAGRTGTVNEPALVNSSKGEHLLSRGLTLTKHGIGHRGTPLQPQDRAVAKSTTSRWQKRRPYLSESVVR